MTDIKRISELPAADQANATDLLEASQANGAGYVTRSITVDQIADVVAEILPPPESGWDDITGKPDFDTIYVNTAGDTMTGALAGTTADFDWYTAKSADPGVSWHKEGGAVDKKLWHQWVSSGDANSDLVIDASGDTDTLLARWSFKRDGSTTLPGPLVGTTAMGDLGPSAAGIVPYGQTYAYNYVLSAAGTHNAQIHAAFATITNVAGSGTFGPGSVDIASLSSIRKDDYLTSDVEGEVSAVWSAAYQGRRGDAAAFIADPQKVRGTGTDTGSVISYEGGFIWLDSAGTVTQQAKMLIGFGESAGGVSDGHGYGFRSESWGNPAGTSAGQLYSAFHADTLDLYSIGSGSSFGTQYVMTATTARTAANMYFRVRGDVVSGSQTPGEIIQGTGTTAKIIRNAVTSGDFQIRNGSDTVTLFNAAETGDTELGFAFGGNYTTLLSGDTGLAAGSALVIKNGATANMYFGNVSTFTGGAYTAEIGMFLPTAGLHIYTGAVENFTLASTGAASFAGAVTTRSGTAIGAGANTQAFIKASSTANLGLYFGTGNPSFSAAKGSIYTKTDATTTTTRLWVNTDGSTTWTNLTTAA